MTLNALNVVLLFLCFTSIAKADYSRMSLHQVIETADIALIGTIVNVDMEYFTVEIERLLYGDYTQKTISVVKFPNWTCHYRFKNYEVGQREILMTKKSNYHGLPFEYISIGAGNEGEIEIIGDYAILLDRSTRPLKFKLDSLSNCIIDYRNIFAEVNAFYDNFKSNFYEPNNENILDTLKLEDNFISEFENKSTIHRFVMLDKKLRSALPISDYKGGLKELKFETEIFRDLFKNFDNKVKINAVGYNLDSVNILSPECIIRKEGDVFYVRPVKGKKTNLHFIYKFNGVIDTVRTFDYFIRKYREPTVEVETFERLKASSHISGQLRVCDGGGTDRSTFYKVHGFSLDIVSKSGTITLKSVSARVTYEMMKCIRSSNSTDKFRVYDIIVRDENGKALEIKPVMFKID